MTNDKPLNPSSPTDNGVRLLFYPSLWLTFLSLKLKVCLQRLEDSCDNRIEGKSVSLLILQ